jgi:hypothetical protein
MHAGSLLYGQANKQISSESPETHPHFKLFSLASITNLTIGGM